ncbi:MAG: 3-hydroxyacyl-CoA dehydrogenase NAD-binding domain-containing protein [Steroidobacteraceae bacterium]
MTTVAIIGAGLLGRGIAGVVVRAGYSVTLHDSFAESLRSAYEQVSSIARSEGVTVRAEADLQHAVADADMVIEAVIENLELKQQLFERMSQANTNAILMSNSSVLPIGQIAARAAQPQRCVGTHWWNPPQLIPVVEVVKGPHTSEAVMQRTSEFLTRLGKTAVRVERDVPGFVGNRLQHALWREALALVSDGVCSAEQADETIARSLGVILAQRGPLAEINRLGPASVAHEFEQVLPQINSDAAPAKLLRDKVARNELGAKSGQGFLSWPAGQREQVATQLQQHVESRLRAGFVDEDREPVLSMGQAIIARRLQVALWREAIALVADGVCDAKTVDLMALNTIGLRLAQMSPITNADYVGLDLTLAIHEAVLPSLNASAEVPALLLHKAWIGEVF